MPMVGNKKYPYTVKGKKAAKAQAAKTGQKVTSAKRKTSKGKKKGY